MLKRGVSQIPYDVPKDLEAAIGDFVSHHNSRRYHNPLRDVVPADVLAGRREEILRRRRGGESQDQHTTQTSQPGPQETPRTSLISLLPNCPKVAEVQL